MVTGFMLGGNEQRARQRTHHKRERKRAQGPSFVRAFRRDIPRPLLPSGDLLMETPQLLSTKPVRKWGHSHVVSLDRPVREALDLKLGDQVTFRKVGRYVFLAVVRAFVVAPISEEERRLGRAVVGG